MKKTIQEARNEIVEKVSNNLEEHKETVIVALNDYLKWFDTIEELENVTGVKIS